jgi:hypothetical protein
MLEVVKETQLVKEKLRIKTVVVIGRGGCGGSGWLWGREGEERKRKREGRRQKGEKGI